MWIDKRLERVSSGNLGDCRSVGEGVCELKIDYGAGYRVYFGQVDLRSCFCCAVGIKERKDRDISNAKEYWRDYEIRQSADQ
ncbi:hypothetical protein QUA97_25800 [Microcoleus sp. CZ3-B2]|uniref:type II toxin-antitoxin system RelE/ParE family toxin n=1 Tax=Microcoleus sp. CZ3-B2 TaxID=2818731 RepID=UPI002FD22B73